MGQHRSLYLFLVFTNTNFTEKRSASAGFELVGVDCEHADHLTTTTAYDAKSYFRLKIVFIGLE